MVQCIVESVIYPLLQLLLHPKVLVEPNQIVYGARTPAHPKIPRFHRRALYRRNRIRILRTEYCDVELLYNTEIRFHYFQYTVVQVPPEKTGIATVLRQLCFVGRIALTRGGPVCICVFGGFGGRRYSPKYRHHLRVLFFEFRV